MPDFELPDATGKESSGVCDEIATNVAPLLTISK
jgi:hypothetical protein